MLTVLIQSLILASGGILSVGSITLVILLLISGRGWRNGLGYMLGYVSAYTLIGVFVVLAGYNASGSSPEEQGMFMSILFIALGLLLFWFAQRNWRKPPAPPESGSSPRLFAIVDKATPPKAFAFGALISVINFKNLAIFLAAISVVHLSNLELILKITIALLIVFVFCLSVIVPVLIYVTYPQRANELLNRLKDTLGRNSHAIGIWVPLVFGFIFLFRGIAGLR